MNLTEILFAAAVLAAIGLAVGVFIGFASIVLDVPVNPKEESILKALPGNNCGGCGYPGCAALAAAIAKGKAKPGACPVGGTKSAEEIGAIIGSTETSVIKSVAFVKCVGDCDKTGIAYDYSGPVDCSMLITLPGNGPKSCAYGCSGAGDCVKACPFGAIEVVNGVAKVSREKCTACGICVSACPKKLIEIIPYDRNVVVACSSRDKGVIAKDRCEVSCTGCGLCSRKCPNEAIRVKHSLAIIDYDKCNDCGECADGCKRSVITKLNNEP